MGIFKIIASHEEEGGKGKGITIGVDVRIADKETPCPVSKLCHSHEELEREAALIHDDLELVLAKAKAFFGQGPREIDIEIGPDMTAEEIWSVLSQMQDEDLLVQYFNGLDDATRGAVAEHVFTMCNIFSGMAAVFSSRYDNKNGYMA